MVKMKAKSLVPETIKKKMVKPGVKKAVGTVRKNEMPKMKSKGAKVMTCKAPMKLENKVRATTKKGEGVTRPKASKKSSSILRAKKKAEPMKAAKPKMTPKAPGMAMDIKSAPKKLQAKVKAAKKSVKV
jgi:hypothetical protein